MKNHDQPHHWGFSVYSSIRLMNPEALAQVLENADPNAVFNDGRTALTLCAKHPEDEPEMARVLIESGARLDLRDSKGMSPLDACLDADNPQMLRLLLASGAKASSVDANGKDALMLSCQSRRWECSMALLNHRADPTLRSFEGLTALMLLAKHSGSPWVSAINSKLAPEARKLAEHLFARGADLDARDDSGWSPLMFAASAGNTQMAQLLLDEGASAQAAPGHSDTPVGIALRMGHDSLADLIRKCVTDAERSALQGSAQEASAPSTSATRL